jgi:hypothetical protein
MLKKPGMNEYDGLDDSRSSQLRTLLEQIGLNDLMKEYPNSMVPLLIEFSVFYRIV